MIKLICMSGQSYYPIQDNAEKVVANNRKFVAVPKSFTIKRATELGYRYLEQDTALTCIGASTDYYYFSGLLRLNEVITMNGAHYDITFGESSLEPMGRIRKTEAKNVIWGGKNLLYQWLHQFYRKLVF